MKLTAEQQRKAEENMGLVGKVLADKVHGRQFGSYTREDLYQIGCIGLCKAAATDKGGCFSTYAYRLIWNEICNALVAATQRENKELVQEDLLAHLAQVPGDNQVKILRRSPQIVKVGADGLKGAGSHGGSHVVGIGDTQIHNGPHRGGLYKGSVSFAANQRRTGTGYGPLSSGTPLTTIAQGIAVLPL